jgi:hypothetical protein
MSASGAHRRTNRSARRSAETSRESGAATSAASQPRTSGRSKDSGYPRSPRDGVLDTSAGTTEHKPVIRVGEIQLTEWPMEWICKRCGCNRPAQLVAREKAGGETWAVLPCKSKVCVA